MNRKLYARIYRENPADHRNPIYVGGYYEKQSGVPAKKFRLAGTVLTALTVVILTLAGSLVSLPAGKVWVAVPYAAAFVPAVLGLFACLQSPGDDGPVREDIWHHSMKRIWIYSLLGTVLCGYILLTATAVCAAEHTFGRNESLFLLSVLICTVSFALLSLLRKNQKYIYKK